MKQIVPVMAAPLALVPFLVFGIDASDRAAPAAPIPTGTAEPQVVPAKTWATVFHGYAFLNANRQGGDSGEQDFESQNHLMVAATRTTGRGALELLGTFTAEPMTIQPLGSPDLFQRGETYRGSLLIDRQHPHDLFVQLAARWSRESTSRARFWLYVAPVGEPALGPTAYVHRASAAMNPAAPLAHHNQDSTHISSDVLTVGTEIGLFDVEASSFHGREPDENRWNVDQGRPDSYAGRVSFRPADGLVIQVSAGRREHPEALEAGDQTRQTVSIEYAKPTVGGSIAASLIVGRNLLEGGQREWGNTLEATWKFARWNTVYGRAERVDRDLYELLNKQQRPQTVPPRRTAVGALTLGYARDLPLLSEAETALGAGLTLYRFDDRLDPAYGDWPVSAQVFLRVGFGSRGMDHHHH